MKTMNVSDLTGDILDWAVLKCLRPDLHPEGTRHVIPRYSAHWSQGGPLLDQLVESGFITQKADWNLGIKCWRLKEGDSLEVQYGPTTLVAVARCFVALNMGAEIEIPEGLLL